MYTFPTLIKKIREESGLTQSQFAEAIDVSPVLVAMVETKQKEVSKSFVLKLAKAMKVHPASITPFLFIEDAKSKEKLSDVEQLLIKWGEKMQNHLIKNRSSLLKKYAE
jgi:transcriptional regulator with XRE-family HTH domain